MSIFQALVLGIVQGLAEFLPISSSGHLILTRWFAGWDDPGIAFDVALHWGTLVGVFIYFRRDIMELISGFIGSLRGGHEFKNELPWQVIIGTIPAGIIGLLFENKAEEYFRSPLIIAIALATFGLLLLIADKKRDDRTPLEQLNWRHALLIGASQGLAIIPGVSRSGISLTVALLLGFERNAAVLFSFLLSIPLILAAGMLKIKYLIHNIHDTVFIAGVLASAISGYIAISFLMKFIRTKSFTPFVIYRLLLAGFIVIWLFTHP